MGSIVSQIVSPPHQRQLNSADPFGKYNCAAYVGAMMAVAMTLRGITITGRTFRAISSEPVPDTDPATANGPGLNHTQMRTVLVSRLRLRAYVRDGQSYESAVNGLPDLDPPGAFAGETRISLSVWYASLGAFRAQTGATAFGHELLLQYRKTVGGVRSIYANDPLASAARWYPESLLREAALEWGRRTGTQPGTIRALESGLVPRKAAYKA